MPALAPVILFAALGGVALLLTAILILRRFFGR